MAKVAHQPPDVPAQLWRAIVNAGRKYNVPPLVLASIWRGESGSTYPNPYVNSEGYGGLFGTKDWNGSTQQQADYAASIFHNALVQTHGNILAANGIYATGKPNPGTYGHAGIPNGTVPGYGGKSSGGGGGGFNWESAIPVPGLPGVTVGSIGAAGSAVADATGLGGIKTAADAFGFIFSLRGLQVIGGGIIMLMGLFLLARQVGLAAAENTPGPIKDAALAAVPEAAALRVGAARSTVSRRASRTRRYAGGSSKPAPRQTVKNVYYLDDRPKRRESSYDPATSDIGF